MDVLLDEQHTSATTLPKHQTTIIVQQQQQQQIEQQRQGRMGEPERVTTHITADNTATSEGIVMMSVHDENIIENQLDDDDGIVEMVEEDTVGQIVQGDDGEYYVVVDDNAPDVGGQNECANSNNSNNSGGNGDDMRSGRSRIVYADDGNGHYEVVEMIDSDNDDGDDENMNMNQTSNHHNNKGIQQHQQNNDSISGSAGGSGAHMMNSNNESNEDLYAIDGFTHPLPQGIKLRRNRVYGTCRCPECGQSFVNTARLERHLAVHQVFGSFLCPLCGKTYKYEYNLFYHWRRTCRDLNGLLSLEERRTMDVGALRQIIEEVAEKKAQVTPIDIGINRRVLYATTPLDKLEIPPNLNGNRGSVCRCCGIVILPVHMPRHLDLHRGNGVVDERSIFGGFCCDLCGLLFRQHPNLIKHWRTGCPEIQANIPEDEEIVLDDDGLKRLVMRLLKRPVTQDAYLDAVKQCDMALSRTSSPQKVPSYREGATTSDLANRTQYDEHRNNSYTMADAQNVSRTMYQTSDTANGGGGVVARGTHEDTATFTSMDRKKHDYDENVFGGGGTEDRWPPVEQDVIYADDYNTEEEAMMMMGDDASLYAGSTHFGGGGGMQQTRNKWSMSGGPVQCPECFRTFANTGRLEKHMAGFHASFGTHHCILCGNRFKYDYNLLYHYRRSCPYTKVYIDREMREQLDATNLRKLVRKLSQQDIQLAPGLLPHIRWGRCDPADNIGSRRQMLRYPTPINQPPPQLLVPRPGLQDAKSCPVCSIIFYGTAVVERHMKAAHPVEWEYTFSEIAQTEGESDRRSEEQEEQYEVEEVEPPPTLTAEPPVEQPIVQNEPTIIQRAHRIAVAGDGTRKLLDVNGIVIEAAEGEEVQVEMDDLGDVQRLIDSGQLQVQHGDQIILVEDGDVDEYGDELGDDTTTTTQYRIVRTEEADNIEEENDIAYEEQEEEVDDQEDVVVQNIHTNRQHDMVITHKDEGLEVAAILTEMKQNELRMTNIATQSGAMTAVESTDETIQQDIETSGNVNMEGRRPEARHMSLNVAIDSISEMGEELNAKTPLPKRRRLATDPAETMQQTNCLLR